MEEEEAVEEERAKAGDLIEAGIKCGKLALESIECHPAPRGSVNLWSYPRNGVGEVILS